MKKSALMAALLGLMLCLGSAQFSGAYAQTVSSFTKATDGALCQLSDGSQLKLQVCGANIIRVVHTKLTAIPSPQSLVVGSSTFTAGTFDAVDNGTAIVVTTPQITATVTKSTGLIAFSTSSGTGITSESARSMTAVTKGGQAGYSGTLTFTSPSSEHIYGLGQLSLGSPGWGDGGSSWWEDDPPDRTGQLNIRGFTFDMHQANWYDVIPFFLTTSGYGVLMNFGCHATKTTPMSITADFLLNNSWDYYFIYGPSFDAIISGYRNITGPAPMLPKWAFGYWQCKNRYMSSSQILGRRFNFSLKKYLPSTVSCRTGDGGAGRPRVRFVYMGRTTYANPAPHHGFRPFIPITPILPFQLGKPFQPGRRITARCSLIC